MPPKNKKPVNKVYPGKKDKKGNTLVMPGDLVYFLFTKDTKHHKAKQRELVHEMVAQKWLADGKGEILGKKADVEEQEASIAEEDDLLD